MLRDRVSPLNKLGAEAISNRLEADEEALARIAEVTGAVTVGSKDLQAVAIISFICEDRLSSRVMRKSAAELTLKLKTGYGVTPEGYPSVLPAPLTV